MNAISCPARFYLGIRFEARREDATPPRMSIVGFTYELSEHSGAPPPTEALLVLFQLF